MNTNELNSISDIKTLINNDIKQISEEADKKLNCSIRKTRIKKPHIFVSNKKCKKCNEEKLIKEFRKQSNSKDGYKGICIKCDDEYQKARYIKLKPQIMNTVKLWQSKNKEKVYNYKKDYKLRHKVKK